MAHYKKLDVALADAMKPACQKYGFITYQIIANWRQIVGEHMAAISFPMEIIFEPNQKINGTLVIGTKNPGFALEIQASQEIILSKLATYFGYKAISRMKMKISKQYSSL
jgi:hypothetical protein